MPLAKTRFTARLIETNGFDPHDFKCWVFSPGMRFNAPDKWWSDYGRRDFPHEGLDFCLFRRLFIVDVIPLQQNCKVL